MIELADLGLRENPPVRFAYEAVAWGTYLDTWASAWSIICAVNRPNFGMCLDTFHIAGREWADPTSPSGKNPNADSDLAASLARLVKTVDAAKVFYVQIADGERLASPLVKGHELYVEGQPARMTWSRNCRVYPYEERGYLPVVDVARAFFHDGVGFEGWVSMELFSRSMAEEGEGVPGELARRAVVAWRALSGELGVEWRGGGSGKCRGEGVKCGS